MFSERRSCGSGGQAEVGIRSLGGAESLCSRSLRRWRRIGIYGLCKSQLIVSGNRQPCRETSGWHWSGSTHCMRGRSFATEHSERLIPALRSHRKRKIERPDAQPNLSSRCWEYEVELQDPSESAYGGCTTQYFVTARALNPVKFLFVSREAFKTVDAKNRMTSERWRRENLKVIDWLAWTVPSLVVRDASWDAVDRHTLLFATTRR